MINFPNCKINIGLEILNKREDGFHNLCTIFYPIKTLHDSLEIQLSNTETEIIVHGLDLNIEKEKNIVYKAYKLLQLDFDLPPIIIHLIKRIPHGAGLGGGSANAAFMVLLLNNFFNINLTQDQLLNYASQLGSDCAFFIINKPCYAYGRGELLEQVNLDLSNYKIAIAKPDVYISTAEAFANITCRNTSSDLKEMITMPITQWKDNIVNDFENSIFKTYPNLQKVKQEFYNKGALYASLSGSGSCMYGIFNKDNNVSGIDNVIHVM